MNFKKNVKKISVKEAVSSCISTFVSSIQKSEKNKPRIDEVRTR